MPNCHQEERAEGETYQQRLTDKGESTNIGDHIFEVFIYIYIYIYLFIQLFYVNIHATEKWRENDRTIYETSISMYITMTYETNIGSITFGVRPDPHERSAIDQEGYTVIFLPMGDSSEAPTVVPPDRVPTMAMGPAVFSTSPSGPSSELTIINRDSQNR